MMGNNKDMERKVKKLFDGVERTNFVEESIGFLEQQSESSSAIDNILALDNLMEFLDELYWYSTELDDGIMELTKAEQNLVIIMRFAVETGNEGILSFFRNYEEEIDSTHKALKAASLHNALAYFEEGLIYFKDEGIEDKASYILELDRVYHRDHKEILMKRLKKYIKNNRKNFS